MDVTLCDGTTVDSASEAWRLECFARHVLRHWTVEQRREHLAKLEKHGAQDKADRLRAILTALHKQRTTEENR